MTSGSALWQATFFAIAVGVIVIETIRGWRLGLVRQLMRILAVVAAYFAAIVGGPLFRPVVRPFVTAPDMVISIAAGVILALITYVAIVAVSSALFKRTRQQEVGPIRLVYGIGGALAGILFGLFTIWLLVVGIRSLGTVADVHLQAQPQSESPRALEEARSVSPKVRSTSHPRPESGLVPTLAKLKNSIELGPMGNVVKQVDVVPASAYDALGKVGKIVSNPDSAERLLSYPGAKALIENPKVIALRDDPEILQLIQEGRLLDLLHNPHIIAVVNDPSVAAQLRNFDLQKALDYALEKR